jgi:hypothetical protein
MNYLHYSTTGRERQSLEAACCVLRVPLRNTQHALSNLQSLISILHRTFASNREIGRDGRLFDNSGQEIIEDVL